MQIRVVTGDITKLEVDAIVNAANSSLLGGGGVDGAIHRAAGKELLEECRNLHGCKTGEAKITKGYHLPAKYIIHTVGPVWNGGKLREQELLANCYRNSIRIAKEYGLHTIAFPAISTGIYKFPKDLAAQIAVQVLRECIEEDGENLEVWLVAFDEETKRLYMAEIAKQFEKVKFEDLLSLMK